MGIVERQNRVQNGNDRGKSKFEFAGARRDAAPTQPAAERNSDPAAADRTLVGVRAAPRKKRGNAGAVVGLLLAGVVAIGAGVGYKMLKHIGGSGKPGSTTPAELIGLLSPDTDKAQFPGKNRVNILLIGKDYNRDKKGMEYTKGARSDSIMVMSLDLDSGKVSALSIPRDTKVTADDGQTGKINGTTPGAARRCCAKRSPNSWASRPTTTSRSKPMPSR